MFGLDSPPSGNLIALVMLWLLCALMAGTIAAGKNRSYGAWFLLGLVTGPLAIVLVSRRPEVVPKALARPCPHCGRTIRKTAETCPFCHGRTGEGPHIDRAAQAGYVAGRLWQRVRRAHRVARREVDAR